ncbi:MAG: histidine kinase [Saprospiraceae bacterium]|nr:histidine kinase [Saprospiraceae bacterium]
MKKVYIYSLVLFAVIISLISWDLYKENYRKDYHYVQTDWTYESSEPKDIGFLVDKTTSKITFFTVLGHTHDHQLCIRYGTVPKVINPSNLGKKTFTSDGKEIHTSQLWVSELFENKNAWSKELSIISQDKILDMTEKNKTYYYKRTIGSGYYSKNMVIISLRLTILLGMYLITFLVLITYEKLRENYFIFAITLVLGLIFCVAFIIALIFSNGFNSLLFNIFIVKNILTFYGLWLLLRYVNMKWGHFDFGKKEVIKFITIVAFGFFAEFIGGHIFNYLFYIYFKGGIYYDFDQFSNIMGWFKYWIYFAIANFTSNLTNYIFGLRNKEKMFSFQKSEGTLASSTLASIQSRINPHFLYNALNSIASLAHTEPKKTEEMALQLAKFYEQCSELKSKPMITLGEELEILKSYLMIEKIRFGDRLQVILPNIDDAMEVMIPSFTLQPIVENAIKYGYNTVDNMIQIRITAETNDKSLTLRIYDSGPPFSENMHSGYGLSSIAKKLKVLYPDRHTFSFVNEPEKCVEIVLKSKK